MGLLEITGTDFAAWNLCCNRENWQTATMTVEEPVDEVKIAGAAAPGTDCKLSSYVRVSAGGKGRYFLVAHMDPLNSFLAPDCVSDPVQRITDDPIDSLDPGFDERLSQAFCYCGHDWFPFIFFATVCWPSLADLGSLHRRGMKNAGINYAVIAIVVRFREVTELHSPL